jgi:hypothetical protein
MYIEELIAAIVNASSTELDKFDGDIQHLLLEFNEKFLTDVVLACSKL